LQPLRMLAIADAFVTRASLQAGLSTLAAVHDVQFATLDESVPFQPRSPSDRTLREFSGSPIQVAAELADHDVLIVHAAPVTDAVLDASPRLKVVAVARGGPVNVDLQAATERGIAVVAAPARNAESVADLTLALLVMLARLVPQGMRFASANRSIGESTFEGAQFFGHELGGRTLGLIGYGNVGARVANRAIAFGMQLLVHDPFVGAETIERPGVAAVTLDALLSGSDFVSVHARSTPANADFMNGARFAQMKRGAYFINTARETLVDETALHHALLSGHIAGAALDVLKRRPDGSTSPLFDVPGVIITPHIGGATFDAAVRGVAIVADDIHRYATGEPMRHVANQHGIRVSS